MVLPVFFLRIRIYKLILGHKDSFPGSVLARIPSRRIRIDLHWEADRTTGPRTRKDVPWLPVQTNPRGDRMDRFKDPGLADGVPKRAVPD